MVAKSPVTPKYIYRRLPPFPLLFFLHDTHHYHHSYQHSSHRLHLFQLRSIILIVRLGSPEPKARYSHQKRIRQAPRYSISIVFHHFAKMPSNTSAPNAPDVPLAHSLLRTPKDLEERYRAELEELSGPERWDLAKEIAKRTKTKNNYLHLSLVPLPR